MKFSSQDIAKFVEETLGSNQHVLSDAMLDQVGANTPRDERGHEYIRIQQKLHETRVNTSSSVKTPCAWAAAIIRCRSCRNRRRNRKSSSDWRSTSLRDTPSSLATLSSSRRT